MADAIRPTGAMPTTAGLQIGDRADKACVEGAAMVVHERGYPIDFATMQAAIDAYLRLWRGER